MLPKQFFERMLDIHQAIKMENTGSRDQFCKTLKIGKTTLWKCFKEFEKKNILIKYDKLAQTYYYAIDKDKEVRVVWEFGLFDKKEKE